MIYLPIGEHNPEAMLAAAKKNYRLSGLFDTGYEGNNGVERTYAWGYLAVRFMLEKQRPKIEQMLRFTRAGDYPHYQALAKSWGTQLDAEFAAW